MSFVSWQYFIFLPVAIITYWLLPPRRRLLLVLAGSYFFYAGWDVRFLALVLSTTVTQCRLEEGARHHPYLTGHGLVALGESLAGPGVYHVSMKEGLTGHDIKQIFSNFSGHLHKDGHQLMARALFEKIGQERAFLGLTGSKVAEVKRLRDGGLAVLDPQPVASKL